MTSAPLAAAELRGPAEVIDADTLEVGGERVRLLDVDAVELGQRCEGGPKALQACGKAAAAALKEELAGKPVACAGTGRDEYGRLLARCAAGGVDLSE